MALVDVSEILDDPEFVDEVTLIHRQACVDDFGENKLREKCFKTYGSVQPISGKTLQRLPEALRIQNIASFWIKGKIISDGTSRYPDIICFRGSRFAVQTILDWTNFGEGWCEGVCVRERPSL